MNLFFTIAVRSLSRRLSKNAIEKALAVLPALGPSELPQANTDSSDRFDAAALQVQIRWLHSIHDFIHDMDTRIAAAKRRHCRLICFPEYYGLLIYLVSPLLRTVLRIQKPASSDDFEEGIPEDAAAIFAPFSFVATAFFDIASYLAKRHSVYLFAGTTPTFERNHVVNRGALFGPTGDELAHVDKLFPMQEERGLGISAGCELPVIQTEIGSIALAVCMDATYFETFRVAKRRGADYIILPIADMGSFDPHLARRGAQCRVTETGLPAIKPALVSLPHFPFRFTGNAGIYFPAGMPLSSVETDQFERDDMAITAIGLKEIRGFDPDPFCRENRKFGTNYIHRLIDFSEKTK